MSDTLRHRTYSMRIDRLHSVAIALLSALAIGQSYAAPNAEAKIFYVSKIGTSSEFTKERADELWDAFRSQYYLAKNGEIIHTEWAKNWVRKISEPSLTRRPSDEPRWNPPPRLTSHFTVIEGLDKGGKPLREYVYAIRSNQSPDEEKAGTDLRFNREITGDRVYLFLADRNSNCPKSFRSGFERCQERFRNIGGERMLQLADMPNSKEAHESFISALKAGSVFRVAAPLEVACTRCKGAGLVANSRTSSSKCESCEGTGKVNKAEVVTFAW